MILFAFLVFIVLSEFKDVCATGQGGLTSDYLLPEFWYNPERAYQQTYQQSATNHSEFKVHFDGSGVLTVTGDANAYPHLGPRFLYPLEADVDVVVKFTKDEACDDHYVVVSTSPDPGGFTWGISPNQVKFAWNCNIKTLYSTSSLKYTTCSEEATAAPSVRNLLTLTTSPTATSVPTSTSFPTLELTSNGFVRVSLSMVYNETFEAGLGRLSNTGPDMNWTLHSGATPSASTGPSGGWDPSLSSQYAYLEASSRHAYPNKTAILESPLIQVQEEAAPELIFYYHMYGQDIGSLHVEAREAGEGPWIELWAANGSRGDMWHRGEIMLLQGSTSLQYRIRGVTGQGYSSDIAVDDIHGPSEDYGNYFGTGEDGHGHFSKAYNYLEAVQDGPVVVRQYESLLIEAGATLTTSVRCKGLLILVKGDCTIDGTLSMTARGAHADPAAEGVYSTGLRFGVVTGANTSQTLSAAEWKGTGETAMEVMRHMPAVNGNGVVITIPINGGGHGGGGGCRVPWSRATFGLDLADIFNPTDLTEE
ncbi:hypothetical protein CYMTET_26334 [Cymbomonas tetramitiformis]|uniref:MAM domain-containing protein n=1 Tax=Cymbomonas tetramitiformis TaxID=36881 RepID=A0AAE0FSB2_9CHLO|nr:hypothetical protein CYMTET_26334 [Cymbomonas tetramitiformis]